MPEPLRYSAPKSHGVWDPAIATLALLVPQSRFGDKLLEIRVVCPHIGTAVLKGLKYEKHGLALLVLL